MARGRACVITKKTTRRTLVWRVPFARNILDLLFQLDCAGHVSIILTTHCRLILEHSVGDEYRSHGHAVLNGQAHFGSRLLASVSKYVQSWQAENRTRLNPLYVFAQQRSRGPEKERLSPTRTI